VLHGDGSGSFSASQVADLHAAPKELLTGDFDGDGLSDLLIVFNPTGEFQLFINRGSSFDGQAPVKLADAFSGATGTRIVGDFDGDGIDDIAAVLFNGTANVVRIMRGSDSGVLTEGQTITPLNNGAAQKLAHADVTGDGRADLLVTVAGFAGQKLVVYPAAVDGQFGTETLLVDGFSGDIAVADLNHDGLLDLLSGSTIRLAQSAGVYGDPQTYYIGSPSLAAKVADVNGDGRPDLIAADDGADALSILFHH
jgi:hypothetical protein